MATILVVDDEKAIRDLVRRILEGAGHSVVEAGDGRQALGLLGREHPELVITDLLMPGAGGAEVVAALRDGRPDVKVLVISGDIRAHRLEPAGTDAVLEKPFRRQDLLDCVGRLLDGA